MEKWPFTSLVKHASKDTGPQNPQRYFATCLTPTETVRFLNNFEDLDLRTLFLLISVGDWSLTLGVQAWTVGKQIAWFGFFVLNCLVKSQIGQTLLSVASFTWF